MSNLPPMRPLKFWTQKIIPLIYDDSLSYLEMLGKVKSKLNELINYYNTLKDEIPKEAQGMYEEISARLEADLQTAINSLNDALTADIADLNDAKTSAISAVNEAANEAKHGLDQYALEEVQKIIADYDSALSPLLTPSATATTLAPGASPTASYNNGVFTFGLPGNGGDMSVAEYGGSEPGVVAEADNAKSLDDSPASDYMKKADYTGNGTQKVNAAQTADNSTNLGGSPASNYMKKADYTGNGTQKVNAAQTADNSTNLGGSPANDYMKKADYVGSSAGTVALADNSSRLGGNLSSYYATADQIGTLQMRKISIPANSDGIFEFKTQSIFAWGFSGVGVTKYYTTFLECNVSTNTKMFGKTGGYLVTDNNDNAILSTNFDPYGSGKFIISNYTNFYVIAYVLVFHGDPPSTSTSSPATPA